MMANYAPPLFKLDRAERIPLVAALGDRIADEAPLAATARLAT